MAQLFQKKYPEINVVVTPGRGEYLCAEVWRSGAPEISRRCYIGGVTTAFEVFYRGKILNSVRAALIFPRSSMSPSGGSVNINTSTRRTSTSSSMSATSASMFPTIPSRSRGRDSFFYGFLNPSGKAKSVARSEEFRQPAHRTAKVLSYAGTGRRVHSPPLRRDGCDVNPGNPSSDRLAGERKFAICFFCSEIFKVKAQGLPVDENSHRQVERETERIPRATWDL